MATMNVSLSDPMRAWIETQVNCGEYANASDYVRDLIRQDQREQQMVRLALVEAENSGISERKVTDIISAAKVRLNRR